MQSQITEKGNLKFIIDSTDHFENEETFFKEAIDLGYIQCFSEEFDDLTDAPILTDIINKDWNNNDPNEHTYLFLSYQTRLIIEDFQENGEVIFYCRKNC